MSYTMCDAWRSLYCVLKEIIVLHDAMRSLSCVAKRSLYHVLKAVHCPVCYREIIIPCVIGRSLSHVLKGDHCPMC